MHSVNSLWDGEISAAQLRALRGACWVKQNIWVAKIVSKVSKAIKDLSFKVDGVQEEPDLARGGMFCQLAEHGAILFVPQDGVSVCEAAEGDPSTANPVCVLVTKWHARAPWFTWPDHGW